MPPITEEGPCDGKHTPIACGEMNVTRNYKERIHTKMKDNSPSHTPFTPHTFFCKVIRSQVS